MKRDLELVEQIKLALESADVKMWTKEVLSGSKQETSCGQAQEV